MRDGRRTIAVVRHRRCTIGTKDSTKHLAMIDHDVDPVLAARLRALCAEGWALWEQFDLDVRTRRFHSFVASEYEVVLAALLLHRGPGVRFLEWGSATGVVTVMADLLGFDACGIELDESLVETASALARRFDSGARFVTGSLVPSGYRHQGLASRTPRLGTGPSGYLQLGRALEDFDVVFGFPWDGHEDVMLDIMQHYGRPDALLLLYGVNTGVTTFCGGNVVRQPS